MLYSLDISIPLKEEGILSCAFFGFKSYRRVKNDKKLRKKNIHVQAIL